MHTARAGRGDRQARAACRLGRERGQCLAHLARLGIGGSIQARRSDASADAASRMPAAARLRPRSLEAERHARASRTAATASSTNADIAQIPVRGGLSAVRAPADGDAGAEVAGAKQGRGGADADQHEGDRVRAAAGGLHDGLLDDGRSRAVVDDGLGPGVGGTRGSRRRRSRAGCTPRRPARRDCGLSRRVRRERAMTVLRVWCSVPGVYAGRGRDGPSRCAVDVRADSSVESRRFTATGRGRLPAVVRSAQRMKGAHTWSFVPWVIWRSCGGPSARRSGLTSSAPSSPLWCCRPARSFRRIGLIEALWPERPPARAAKTVQVYISRLRKTLNGAHAGTSASAGCDRHRRPWLRVARRSRAGRRARVRAAPRSGARGVWRSRVRRRGDGAQAGARAVARRAAVRTSRSTPSPRREIARLQELRLEALEIRIDADLALGRHAALVAELEALTTEHPLRERLRAARMLALYRCGREPEALDAVPRDAPDAGRRAGDGAEPRAARAARRDPPTRPRARSPQPRPSHRPAPAAMPRVRRRRRAAVAIAALGLVGGVAGA